MLAIWIGCGFAANYAWEMVHMRLFVGMRDGWLRCAFAAAADVAVLAFLYAVMAAAGGSLLWFREKPIVRAIALAAIGGLAAATIELRALAAGAWSYDSAMLLVPVLHVGLSPVLQMVMIPLGLTWLSRRAVE